MPGQESPTNKCCPKCKQVDRTTFSSCRYCGTKYDLKVEEKSFEPPLFLIGAIFFVVIMLSAFGYSVYQYQQGQEVYRHTEKFVGKTFKCKQSAVLAGLNRQGLQEYDAELFEAQARDPKKYGGKAATGMLAAATALDNLNSGKDDEFSLSMRYIRDGKLAVIHTDDRTPLSVVVLSGDSSGKTPMVQVKVLNGDKVGTMCWMNADDLDIASGV